MTECSVFFQIRTVCPNTVYFSKFSLYDRVQYIFHINTTRLSIVHFQAIHYTTECNVFFVSTLCIVSLKIVYILFYHNLSSKQRQRGATVDTQFRDSWVSMWQRTPMMRKSWIGLGYLRSESRKGLNCVF